MNYQESLYWIRQEAALNGVTIRQHIRAILTDYANKQKSSCKVVPIRRDDDGCVVRK